MTEGRAWSLITLAEEDLQYAGNAGYSEDFCKLYRYDKSVANHKKVAVGDLVLLRDRQKLLGAARIERIDSSPATKLRRRCPSCAKTALRQRKNAALTWRCSGCGEAFSTPTEQQVETVQFTAHYANTFVEASNALSAQELKLAALRPNDQLSIEQVDIKQLMSKLWAVSEPLQKLLSFDFESDIRPPAAGEADDYDDSEDYTPSGADQRHVARRQIKLRRGQFKFRNNLLKRFNGKCVVSDCPLLDLLEAAHISPYRGPQDNHVSNGLILRADLHTLFDLFLLGIDPQTMQACFHPKVLAAGGYVHLQGRVVLSGVKKPSTKALLAHWDRFQKVASSPN